MFWTKNISITYLRHTPNYCGIFFQSKRWKSKRDHWAAQRSQKTASMKALDHFDDFYGSVYGRNWSSIRVALLSPHRYCAVVNNFGNTDATLTLLENEGAHNMRDIMEHQKCQINQKTSDNKRNRQLNNAFTLDKKLSDIVEKKREEDIQKLYPEHTDTLQLKSEKQVTDNEEGIDWSRQINPSSGLSAASLYDFIPTTELKGREDWVSESVHYSYYEKYSQVPIKIVNEDNLNFPEHLKVYSFEMSNISYFPEPRRGPTGVLNYYLMNASSLLPVLALNLAPGDHLLDMCAAPGGKTIVSLQTLYPEVVVSNDQTRSERLKRVLRDYFYDVDKRVKVTKVDARNIDEVNVFNKILVDVPCTNDRHSVIENDNNIFRTDRLKERFKLPEKQAELLSNALKLVTVGGTVVYSTCSLSPIQNDGVVQMALRRVWEDSNRTFVVKNMKKALDPAKIFYKFGEAHSFKYGHIVIPYLPANYGPLYFCKLVRTE